MGRRIEQTHTYMHWTSNPVSEDKWWANVAERHAPWIISKLWSSWDQSCAREEGWVIIYHAINLEWNVHALHGGRFDTHEDARAWVKARADQGSRRHERAIFAIITATMQGYEPLLRKESKP
jgi:hypothetical protein